MSELLAYLAGIVDADGTIGVKRSTYAMRRRGDAGQPVFSERVAVRQVSSEAVELLHLEFGGSLYLMAASAKNGKALYSWTVSDGRATKCLQALLPYLRIKVAQAENALALRSIKERSKRARVAFGRGHQGAAARPTEIGVEMEACYQCAKRLNSVGTGGGGGDAGAVLAV